MQSRLVLVLPLLAFAAIFAFIVNGRVRFISLRSAFTSNGFVNDSVFREVCIYATTPEAKPRVSDWRGLEFCDGSLEMSCDAYLVVWGIPAYFFKFPVSKAASFNALFVGKWKLRSRFRVEITHPMISFLDVIAVKYSRRVSAPKILYQHVGALENRMKPVSAQNIMHPVSHKHSCFVCC